MIQRVKKMEIKRKIKNLLKDLESISIKRKLMLVHFWLTIVKDSLQKILIIKKITNKPILKKKILKKNSNKENGQKWKQYKLSNPKRRKEMKENLKKKERIEGRGKKSKLKKIPISSIINSLFSMSLILWMWYLHL